jgi:hypothetical protein
LPLSKYAEVIEDDTCMTDGPDCVGRADRGDHKLRATFGLDGDWVPARESAT